MMQMEFDRSTTILIQKLVEIHRYWRILPIQYQSNKHAL